MRESVRQRIKICTEHSPDNTLLTSERAHLPACCTPLLRRALLRASYLALLISAHYCALLIRNPQCSAPTANPLVFSVWLTHSQSGDTGRGQMEEECRAVRGIHVCMCAAYMCDGLCAAYMCDGQQGPVCKPHKTQTDTLSPCSTLTHVHQQHSRRVCAAAITVESNTERVRERE